MEYRVTADTASNKQGYTVAKQQQDAKAPDYTTDKQQQNAKALTKNIKWHWFHFDIKTGHFEAVRMVIPDFNTST